MILKDLTAAKRREVVRLTLAPVLRALTEETSTAQVAGLIADALGTREKPLVAQVLLSLAKAGMAESQVRRVGEPFTRFGRVMRRWTWGPIREQWCSEPETEVHLED